MAKEFLSRRGIKFVERNVAADHSAANEMIRISGQRGVPVITIDGQVVVGFDRPRLEQLLAAATEGAGLGASVIAAATYARNHNLTLPEGAYVGAVKPGGLAGQAGLQVGDVIVGLAGRPVHGVEDLRSLLGSLRGQRVALAYWRNGETRSVDVSL